MIDFGSFAPMGVFVEAFRKFGVEATIEEAREPMGACRKRDHINDDAGGTAALPREWERLKGHGTGRGRYRRGLRGLRADERGGGRALRDPRAGRS
jgi:hypothetical protein